MTGFEQELAAVQPYLQEYGYVAVFVVLFLESFGAPVPGESLLIAAALLAAHGDLHVVPLLGAAWSAAVLGDNVGYGIGRFGGRRLVEGYGPKVGITAPRLARVEDFFRRYGPEVVLVARFFVLLRQLNGVTAGTVDMPWHRFLLYNAVGAALWVGFWGLGVYFVGEQVGTVFPWLRRLGYAALAAAIAVVVVLLALRHLRKSRRS
jgi:membrane protein DedA with SNARE-associated domain